MKERNAIRNQLASDLQATFERLSGSSREEELKHKSEITAMASNLFQEQANILSNWKPDTDEIPEIQKPLNKSNLPFQSFAAFSNQKDSIVDNTTNQIFEFNNKISSDFEKFSIQSHAGPQI